MKIAEFWRRRRIAAIRSWKAKHVNNDEGEQFRQLDTVNGSRAEEQEQPCSSSSPTEVEETEDEEGDTKAKAGAANGRQDDFRKLLASLMHKQQQQTLPTVSKHVHLIETNWDDHILSYSTYGKVLFHGYSLMPALRDFSFTSSTNHLIDVLIFHLLPFLDS